MILENSIKYYSLTESEKILHKRHLESYMEYLNLNFVIKYKGKIKMKCICENDFLILEKFINSHTSLELKNILTKFTSLKNYGVDSPNKSNDVKNKKKLSCLERYGVDNFSKTEEFKNKVKETCLKHYGVDSYLKLSEPHEKLKESLLFKYNVTSPFQIDEIKNKSIETKIKRYNDPNFINREKSKQTCLEKYGVEYYIDSDDFKNKSQESFIAKYNVDNPIKNKEISQKVVNTKLNRYGTISLYHSYNYNNIDFDSSWEVYFYIYHHDILKDNIKRGPKFNYFVENILHIYECDFEIDGNYYEIKGSQFLKDGKLYFPYNYNKEYNQRIWDEKYNCMKNNNVEIISDINMYKNLVDDVFGENFIENFKKY